jgi:CheY-like chemotaxis protein
LINIFKQLIVPWLLTLLLVWLLVSVWLYNDSRSQQQLHIKQLGVTVDYAIKAYLSTGSNEQLDTLLGQIHYSSPLAVQQIAIYNSQRQYIASSTSLFKPPELADTPLFYQFTTLDDGSQLALLPLNVGASAANVLISGQLGHNGYIAVVFVAQFGWLVWSLSLALLSAVMATGLALSVAAIKRGQLRHNTDIELLTHNMQRLQAAQQQCQLHELLVPALWPLQQAFNKLAGSIDQRTLDSEQLVQQLNQRLQQLNVQSTELSQKNQHSMAKQQGLQRQMRHWFEQSQLLWQRKEQLQFLPLQRLLQLHLLAGYYQFSQTEISAQPFNLASWLSQQVDDLNGLLPSESVRLDWLEHPDNLGYTVYYCRQTLSSLVQALLMLCLRAEDVSKTSIALKLQFNGEQHSLSLVASCNGNGLPEHCRQLLQTADMLDLQWSDADIALLNAIKTTGASFTSQTLDGLGCILELTLPMQTEVAPAAKLLQHLLVFDADAERLQLRSAAFSAIAAQVTLCSNVSQLEQLIQHTSQQFMLVFVPVTPASADWQRLFILAKNQPDLLCVVPAIQFKIWQDAMQNVFFEHQFCLARLIKFAEVRTKITTRQHILVVDDNETNLAFVQVLLKNKPLKLHTATSAAQVFLLCQQQKFDMILLDIQLPDMSGVDVARQLRQLPQYQNVPIVAFTAHAMPDEIDRYRQAGMDDIIFKPLEPARLDSLLAKFCFAPA